MRTLEVILTGNDIKRLSEVGLDETSRALTTLAVNVRGALRERGRDDKSPLLLKVIVDPPTTKELANGV